MCMQGLKQRKAGSWSAGQIRRRQAFVNKVLWEHRLGHQFVCACFRTTVVGCRSCMHVLPGASRKSLQTPDLRLYSTVAGGRVVDTSPWGNHRRKGSHNAKAGISQGVQLFGISGPHWKKKSCLGPPIKYTNSNKKLMSKKKVLSKFTTLSWAPFTAILGPMQPTGRGSDSRNDPSDGCLQ